MVKNIIVTNNKYYFLSIYQEIFESTISFYNLCLLQYEEIVKNFGEQTYMYLGDLQLLHNDTISFKYNNIVINYNSVTNYTCDIDLTTAENKIYLYCTNDYVYTIMSNIIEKNSISSLNILYALNNFRIPYFGRVQILNNYLFSIPKRGCSFTINVTKLKEYLDISDNQLYRYLQIKSYSYYYRYRSFFEVYRKTKFVLFDLIFSSKLFIFENYAKLIENGADEDEIEEYIKGQNKYFQMINYGTEETYINDNSDVTLSTSVNLNTIINNFLDYFFLELMTKKADIINVPLFLENNTIYSKNLCYFLLLKQIRILNQTININNIFNEAKLEEIYNSLNKGISTIEDCVLDKYYSHDKLNKIGFLFKNQFYSYFQLENCRKNFLFKLVENDENSYFYFFQHVYPAYATLKELDPRYFPINQLNIYSFSSATPSFKSINNSEHSINCFEKLVFLYLFFLWGILLFTIICILNRVKYIVIKPILNLREVLNKREITDETKFEYQYDDQINEFFRSCKLLLSSNTSNETNKNELTNMVDKTAYDVINSSNKDDKQNINNNNMILNLKMINELIESDKKKKSNGTIIEWNWKQIYNKQKNPNGAFINNDNYLIKKRTNRKVSNQTIILKNKESSKSNVFEFDFEKNEIKFKDDDDEKTDEDLLSYEYLLLITEYLYNNGQYHEKLNKYKNNAKSIDIINKIKNFLSMQNNKTKDITYIWYSKMKENNKTDFIKSYFNKSFEDIFLDEPINNISHNNTIK